jgi:hypothetical protein
MEVTVEAPVMEVLPMPEVTEEQVVMVLIQEELGL